MKALPGEDVDSGAHLGEELGGHLEGYADQVAGYPGDVEIHWGARGQGFGCLWWSWTGCGLGA